MPSIIFGAVGVIMFCELFGLGVSLIAGGLSPVMMTLPTVIRTTQESLKTVPQSYREGSLAPGQRQVAHDSHRGPALLRGRHRHGCILAVGRIVGESAVLMFTAGMGRRAGQVRRHRRRVFQEPVRQFRRDAHRRPLQLRKGARRLRFGLCRGRRAACHRLYYQHSRKLAGKKLKNAESGR